MFFFLDADGGHWQVKVEKIGGDKLAFTSRYGLYRFVKISVALKNASAPF